MQGKRLGVTASGSNVGNSAQTEQPGDAHPSDSCSIRAVFARAAQLLIAPGLVAAVTWEPWITELFLFPVLLMAASAGAQTAARPIEPNGQAKAPNTQKAYVALRADLPGTEA